MTVYGLEMRGLEWSCGPSCLTCHAVDPDPVLVARGALAVVAGTGPEVETLADVLTGVARPRRGTVHSDGSDVTALLPAPDRIALVPAGAALLPMRSVESNIAFALPRTGGREARRLSVRELADELDLVGLLALRPAQLTDEQRLRVAVARALGRQPAAVVVEDRDGAVSCRPAVRAVTEHGVAALVVTDSAERAGRLAGPVHGVTTPATPPAPAAERVPAGAAGGSDDAG